MKDKSTVLIVDDDPLARDIMEGFLFQEGYELLFAGNGTDALAMIQETAPDIILLDVMMPDLDGFEVCQRLKSNSKLRHIPIILVTALGGKTDLARGFMVGADDFLHKPVNDIEIRARVRAMLRLKKQHDELRAMLQLREELAHMIVHDIRSPLTTIMGYCELMLVKGGASPEFLSNVQKIRTQAASLNSFLNDMLILAKMESNQLILHCADVDVTQLAKQVNQSYNLAAQLKRINLVLDFPAQTEHTYLDANLFQRVIDNLLSNAIKFSSPDSTVITRVAYPRREAGGGSTEPQLRFQVIDEGLGVPEEHRERIFDKFQILSLPDQSSDTSQLGLGLAFCNMVVKAHSGQIFVTANQPAGSIFTVEIW